MTDGPRNVTGNHGDGRGRGGGPLSGVRVIDLAGLAGAYGTRLLAMLGADVVKVEPPEGDGLRRLEPFVEGVEHPEASLWWAYFSMGKKSVVVGDGDHSALRRLLDGADIVVTTGNGSGPGGDERWPVREALAADERLIHVSITPFGATGPRRDWRGSNLIAFASSGILTTVGFPGEAPLVPGGPAQLACHLAALNAAAGALLALQSRRRTGRGQLVDISLQEACLWLSPETGMPVFLDDGVHRTRPGNRREVVRPWGLYPAKDGYVSFLIIQPADWDAMARWIADVTGNDVLLEEVFRDLSVRMQSMELCDEHTEELTRRFTKRELFLEGQRRSIPITPVNTMADLRDDPHLLAAGFWLDVEHPKLGTVSMPGPPFRPHPWSMDVQRAPLLGEHTATYLA